MITPREGRLAGDEGASESFLEAHFDRSTESFHLNKRGVLWEAVLAARELGAQQQVNRRRKIAVLDTDFDLSIKRLAQAAVPESTVFKRHVGRFGQHGTAVALLINEIAPDAELLLIDVWPGTFLSRQTVSDALIFAADQGADIINLSLEFISDAESNPQWDFDAENLVSENPKLETVIDAVEEFLLKSEPYTTDGCKSECVVCNAVKSLPSNIVVVAACGNSDKYACPACVQRSVGVGFHLEEFIVDMDVGVHLKEFIGDMGSRVVTGQSGLVYGPTLYCEVSVPQPPGFEGTSFASPLVAGLAGIVEDPLVYAKMARLHSALAPIGILANKIVSTPFMVFSKNVIKTWKLSLSYFSTHIPVQHRHWEREYPEICPTCAHHLIDWYNQVIVMHLLEGDVRAAIHMGEVAANLSPYSASAAGNLGEAYFRLINAYPADAPKHVELIELSQSQFTRAHQLAPEVQTYAERLNMVGNLASKSSATFRNSISSTWDHKGDDDKAIEYYEQALASDLKTLGPDHPGVAIDRNNLGLAWRKKGDYDKAIEYYEEALASELKTLGPDHPQVATVRNNLGLVWRKKGDYDKAIEYFRSALRILENHLGHNDPSTNTVRKNLKSTQAGVSRFSS